MNRRRLAIIAGIIILAAALLMLLWPDNQADPRTEDKVAETELPEGFVLIDDDQIRAAEIKVAAVQTGATVELVFPATVAASPSRPPAPSTSMRAILPVGAIVVTHALRVGLRRSERSQRGKGPFSIARSTLAS